MQSLQMRCPSRPRWVVDDDHREAEIACPLALEGVDSEIFSSSGQPASVTPKALFLNVTRWGASGVAFSFQALAQQSFPCVWHQMQ